MVNFILVARIKAVWWVKLESVVSAKPPQLILEMRASAIMKLAKTQ